MEPKREHSVCLKEWHYYIHNMSQKRPFPVYVRVFLCLYLSTCVPWLCTQKQWHISTQKKKFMHNMFSILLKWKDVKCRNKDALIVCVCVCLFGEW